MPAHSPQIEISHGATLHRALSGSGCSVGRIRGRGRQVCKKTLEMELTKHSVMLREVQGDGAGLPLRIM